jgi:hypothetical protein
MLLEPELKPGAPLPMTPKTKLEDRHTRFIAWKMSNLATKQFASECKSTSVTFNSGTSCASLCLLDRILRSYLFGSAKGLGFEGFRLS